MDFTKTEKTIFVIPTYRTVLGHKTYQNIEIDLSGYSPKSLVCVAVREYRRLSNLTIPNYSCAERYRSTLRALSEKTQLLLNQSPNELTRYQIIQIFNSSEKDLSALIEISGRARFQKHQTFRKLLTFCTEPLIDGYTVEQAAKTYQAKKPLPDISIPNNLLDPISSIPHSDIKDLYHQADLHIKHNVRRIEKACENDIDEFTNICALQNSLIKLPIAPDIEEKVIKIISAPSGARKSDWGIATQEQLAAICLKFVQSLEISQLSSQQGRNFNLPSHEELDSLLNIGAYRMSNSCIPWFCVQQRLPNLVLTSLFIYISLKTGWNPGSVGQLAIDSIQITDEGAYVIQSYKSKTDDETPRYEIQPNEHYFKKCIDLLIWNHHQVKLIESLPEQIKSLWLGWRKSGSTNYFFNPIHRLQNKKYFAKHGLPKFSPSDLRPLRASASYLPQKDIEAVRLILGHSDLQTSSDYLEGHLFFRMHEAMMLEFQRRIETTVMYQAKGIKGVVAHKFDSKYIDKSLLVPTGDGGACSNIFEGPSSNYLKGDEPCDGLFCQQGKGCPNYRLVVDNVTIEAALRTKQYYQSRWKSLAEKNAQAFSVVHIPRLIYMHVLLRIVKEQKPNLYKSACKVLENGDKK